MANLTRRLVEVTLGKKIDYIDSGNDSLISPVLLRHFIAGFAYVSYRWKYFHILTSAPERLAAIGKNKIDTRRLTATIFCANF
jgi:hypothetical protein